METREQILKFKFRTGDVSIDLGRCVAPECRFACVKACRFYGRGVLKIEGGRPALAVSSEDVPRLCNECLACEIGCELRGNNSIRIVLPIFGLQEYRRSVGLPAEGGM